MNDSATTILPRFDRLISIDTLLYYCTLNSIDWDSVDSIPGMLAADDMVVDRLVVLDQMDDFFVGGWFL